MGMLNWNDCGHYIVQNTMIDQWPIRIKYFRQLHNKDEWFQTSSRFIIFPGRTRFSVFSSLEYLINLNIDFIRFSVKRVMQIWFVNMHFPILKGCMLTCFSETGAGSTCTVPKCNAETLTNSSKCKYTKIQIWNKHKMER